MHGKARKRKSWIILICKSVWALFGKGEYVLSPEGRGLCRGGEKNRGRSILNKKEGLIPDCRSGRGKGKKGTVSSQRRTKGKKAGWEKAGKLMNFTGRKKTHSVLFPREKAAPR